MGFQENLRRFRESQGITAKELAARVGIKYSTLISYETAGKEPRLETLCKLAAALHTTTDRLLGYSLPSVDIQANIARLAGLVVKEKGGRVSVSVPPKMVGSMDSAHQKLIDLLNLAPLPATDFIHVVEFSAESVLKDNKMLLALRILSNIDNQNALMKAIQDGTMPPPPGQEQEAKKKPHPEG